MPIRMLPLSLAALALVGAGALAAPAVAQAAPCSAPVAPIGRIQGAGAKAALTGPRTVRGVVVGDFEGANSLRGFYLQDAGDGNPATSDGIFVFNGANTHVVVAGDVVQVTGTVGEFEGQTQISLDSIEKCGTGTVAPTEVRLPLPQADFLERYEGMLVRLPQTLVVTEHFQLGRFGQLVLSSGARLRQPTDVAPPGAAARALQAANALDRIIVDDASQLQNPDPVPFGRGGRPLSAANTLRGGDSVTGLVGVLTYTWGGHAASGNAWRLRPIGALGGGVPRFAPTNARPARAPDVGGTTRVASFNLLNYFDTFADRDTATPGCFPSGEESDCRGANGPLEFERQAAKTVAALHRLDAHVVGLMELENDGYGAASSIADLVRRLNARTPGRYAYLDVDAATGRQHALGRDAIRVALLYQPAHVRPVGRTALLDSVAFVNGGDPAPRNRVALLQAFETRAGAERFSVAVNHFKSRSSSSPCETAPDAGDGQGMCNGVRVAAATELAKWLRTDPTGTGDPDVLVLGDLNAYSKEAPLAALAAAGYSDLLARFAPARYYGYAFGGQWGSLDHALASASLARQVTGAAPWNVNADEPNALDYNLEFRSAEQRARLYAPDQYRSSDHDPVLVGLRLGQPLR